MFSLVRSGPKMLLFESDKIEDLSSYLITGMGACEYDRDTAFERAGEDYTIIFITDKIKAVVDVEEIKDVLVVMEEPDVLLCRILNEGKMHLINRARIAPRILILRVMGDMDRVVEEISKDYKCIVGRPMDILNTHNENGTVVAITDKPIHRNMSVKDMYEKALYVEEKYRPLLRSLRSHALKYLNTGLANKDWYEIEIRIFDRYSAYTLHYERLINVLEYLELGIILGESWGKDYPRPMMSVEVYRVRFFTFHEPKYIKRILLGLEYLEDGTRIVDYDVYYNRKKVDWGEASEDGAKVRHILGMKSRTETFSKLGEDEKSEIYKLEQAILETRT
ncbi:MAG: hypothetical protein ACM3TR_08850 [Caulobacteraceae bacterium]